MPSIQSKLFTLFFRLIRKKGLLRKQLVRGKGSIFTSPEPPDFLLKYCNIRKTELNGQAVYTLIPKHLKSNKHILYLHGGAYVQGMVIWHWKFIGELMRRCNCTITIPDYPLAPGCTYEVSFEMVQKVYQELLSDTPSNAFIFMGDSSGGGFALALGQLLERNSLPQPGQLILLSPWLDLTLTNPAINSIEAEDPFLDRESLRTAGRLYAGCTPVEHFLLSPINGSLKGLGRISLFTGSKDLLVADARKLQAMAMDQGIELLYFEYPDMVHAWMFMPLPESKEAMKQITELILQ